MEEIHSIRTRNNGIGLVKLQVECHGKYLALHQSLCLFSVDHLQFSNTFQHVILFQNRARELRSKIKEQRSVDNGDDASNAIMSSREIQRQRRSRQLEETQRLLDRFADTEVDEERRVSSNHSLRSGNVSSYRHGSSIDSQVASSQELLGSSHRREKYSTDLVDYAASEARQLVDKKSSQMILAESRSVRETSHRQPGQFGRGRGRGRSGSGGATSTTQVGSSLQSSKPFPRDDNDIMETTRNRQGQDRNNFSTSIESTSKPQCYYLRDLVDYAASEARQLVDKKSSQMILAESRSVRETSHRQPGQFGRGRGRGRSGSGGATSTTQVGSSLQSSKPFPRDDNDIMETTRNRQGQDRNNFSTSIESTSKPQCYYLRDHRVPEHKEGECDKLVVLRQRLAARRRMRELALEGKKEQTIEPSQHGMEKLRNVTSEVVPHELSTQQYAKPFSRNTNNDVDDSNCSYRSSYNSNATQMNVSTESGGSIVSEKSVVNIELIQCDCCGRSFAPKVYEKHFDSSGQPKCANDKKRSVFNSAKARIANNSNLNQDEQMQVLQMNKKVTKDLKKKKSGKGRSTEKIRRSSKWREESRNFRDAMKASRL